MAVGSAVLRVCDQRLVRRLALCGTVVPVREARAVAVARLAAGSAALCVPVQRQSVADQTRLRASPRSSSLAGYLLPHLGLSTLKGCREARTAEPEDALPAVADGGSVRAAHRQRLDHTCRRRLAARPRR